MTNRRIKYGAKYHVSIGGTLEGDPVTFDGTWEAAMRVTTGGIGGTTFLDIPLTLEAGAFVAEIDTSESPWQVGNYYYDIRLTTPDGEPVWSEGVSLTLESRNTPPE